jgi:hypothetical protein
MKKKLPIVTAKKPSSPDLKVAPVAAGSRPEFPTRMDMYRKAKAGLIGGATLLAGTLAHADAPKPAPQAQVAQSLEDGSINGKALAKTAPKVKVYREGGGIGPAEDMWNLEDVESFVSWTMAKEGKLNLQTNYKLELDGLKLNLDGFDPDRNIGFEYIDSHDSEASTYSASTRAKLDAWMKAQKVAILFIEVKKLPDTATLRGKVVKFLNTVKKTPPNPGRIMPAQAPTPVKK